jgi:hypothetical protein
MTKLLSPGIASLAIAAAALDSRNLLFFDIIEKSTAIGSAGEKTI